MTPAIAKVLEIARRKLLDTGTRNRLVHVNRYNQRANCLNVINERSGDVYKTLRLDGKRMRFKATGKDRTNSENEILLAMSDTKSSNQPDRHTEKNLETPLGSEALAHRLLRLAHDARTAEEEQGLNLLYLAVGFLRWREDKNSEIWRVIPPFLTGHICRI